MHANTIARLALCAGALALTSGSGLAHDGEPGDHLNIGYYFGHDGTFSGPAVPHDPATLLVDTHPWELGEEYFGLEEVSNILLDGWFADVPGFESLSPSEQEFDGHGFYSWLDAGYSSGAPTVLLHLDSADPGLRVLSPLTLTPLPDTVYLGTDFHTHAIFFVDRSVNPQPGQVFRATFHLSDAAGRLADSEPFTLQLTVDLCRADLTGDDEVNTNDFFQFLSLYQAQDARADFTGDSVVNTNDFFAFLAVYQVGC